MRTLQRIILSVAFAVAAFASIGARAQTQFLNVSYDPTREFYESFNTAFAKHWKAKSGGDVKFLQSHGGSGKQARAVIDGLEADVVTLALAFDIDEIAAKSGLINTDWQTRFPDASSPYVSTIVFLVHKGNPKGIKDWDDLTKEGVAVITPNPKTSGGARWNYLAAWGYAKRKFGDDTKAKDFVAKLFKNVPVLDSGARGSTTTFAERGIGDVLVTWENEAHLALTAFGSEKFEIVNPSLSILAEPPVALVDKNVDRHKTRDIAEEYLKYLYSDEGQELAAINFYRPRNAAIAAKYPAQFPKLEMLQISDFGGWAAAQREHFSDGGTFDQIYAPGK